jgi:hypothetical protein
MIFWKVGKCSLDCKRPLISSLVVVWSPVPSWVLERLKRFSLSWLSDPYSSAPEPPDQRHHASPTAFSGYSLAKS